MDNYSLPVCTEVFASTLEKPISFEAILPEYCPGIHRILKAEAIAAFPDTSFSGGVISINAPCTVRILYTGENNNLKSVAFEQSLDFGFDASKISDSPGEMQFFTRICIPKAYAKPKSARSMEIKLDTSVNVSVCRFDSIELFSQDFAASIETKRECEQLTERIVFIENKGEIADTVTLDSSLPAASELIDRSVCLSVTNTEAKNGCIKYSGNALFKCTYRTTSVGENQDSEYIYLKKDIPFDGEIVSDRIADTGNAVLDVTLTGLDVNLSADPYGENRIINISAGFSTHAEFFLPQEAEFTYDGFCSMYECEFESTEYCYDILTDTIDISDKMTESIPLNGTNLDEITDAEIKTGSYCTELHDGKVCVSVKAHAIITGSDDKGEPCCVEHRFNIRRTIDENESEGERKYIICCKAISGDAILKDGELALDYTLHTKGVIMNKKCIKAISGADISYENPKPVCRSEYIIYYPDKKETLWDIAKKYEIPQKKLADANGLDESQSLNKKTVLIPCAL